MKTKTSTESTNSQDLHVAHSQNSRPLPGALLWLVLSALLWGAPIIMTIYLPLLLVEALFTKIPGLKILASVARCLKDEAFVWGIFCYLRMQLWFRADLDFSEIHRLIADGSKFMIVANHRSHLDVFFMIAHIRGVRVLAKSSLFKIPLLGFVMQLSKQIPAERGSIASLRAAMILARKRMDEKNPVLIFPEFTRCEAGFMGVNQFSLLPFQTAREADIFVVPLVIHNTDEVWPRNSNTLHRGAQISIKALSATQANKFGSAEELRDFVKARIIKELHEN